MANWPWVAMGDRETGYYPDYTDGYPDFEKNPDLTSVL